MQSQTDAILTQLLRGERITPAQAPPDWRQRNREAVLRALWDGRCRTEAELEKATGLRRKYIILAIDGLRHDALVRKRVVPSWPVRWQVAE